MLNIGIHIQRPLLQTTLKALKNFSFHIVQRIDVGIWFGVFFFLIFPCSYLNFMKMYAIKKKKINKLSNYIPNVTAVLTAALKVSLITKTYSGSIYPLQVNHRKFLLFSN